jgi:hydroxymethylbilane synthase
LPPGLALVAVLERADPRDALVSAGAGLDALPAAARVGTTSLRRRALLKQIRPDLTVVDLRGNIDTRLRRRREGEFDAILLAMAGLARLGRTDEVTEALDADRFVPAPGQGAIALEARDGDEAVRDAVTPLAHGPTARAVAAERALLSSLGGGCNVPLGALARESGDGLRLVAFVADPDGGWFVRSEGQGVDPVALGQEVAADLRAREASTPRQ